MMTLKDLLQDIARFFGFAEQTQTKYKRDCQRCMRYLVKIRTLYNEIEHTMQERRFVHMKLCSNTLQHNEYGNLYNRQSILELQYEEMTREMDTLQADLDYIVSKYL